MTAAAGAPPAAPSTTSRAPAGTARSALLLAALFTAVGSTTTPDERGQGVLMLLLAAGAAAWALLGRDRAPADRLRHVPSVLIALVALAGVGRAVAWLPISVAVGAAVAVLLLPLLVLAGRGGRVGLLAALAAAVLLTAFTVVPLTTGSWGVDVGMFQEQGVRELLRGGNPWAMTFPNVYSPELAARFYAPEVLDGDRLLFGFPYPPLALIGAIPGVLLGDVRIGSVVALTGASLLLRAGAVDALGRRAALVLPVVPGAQLVVFGAWTEPVTVGLLALLTVALVRDWRIAPYLLGLFLVAKQYMVVMLPLARLTRPRATPGFLGRAALAGTVVTLPFLLWDPAAFWRSVVELQFRQPYRADSTSLLVWVVEHSGRPAPALLGLLPLAAAGVTSLVLAVRAPRTPAATAAGFGLTLLVLALLSKQAFANYYLLVSGAFLIAAAVHQESDRAGAELRHRRRGGGAGPFGRGEVLGPRVHRRGEPQVRPRLLGAAPADQGAAEGMVGLGVGGVPLDDPGEQLLRAAEGREAVARERQQALDRGFVRREGGGLVQGAHGFPRRPGLEVRLGQAVEVVDVVASGRDGH